MKFLFLIITISIVSNLNNIFMVDGYFTPIDACFLPSNSGYCVNLQTRYFYNSETKLCEQFTYNGCGGNANRFPSQSECEKNCVNPCVLPLDTGTGSDRAARYFYDSGSKLCQQFWWTGADGNLNNFESLTACQKNCSGIPNSECLLPLVVGSCKGAISRFFFNYTSKRCEKFTYTGCEGNQNNFVSSVECERSCVDICHLPAEIGACTKKLTRYYYNPVNHNCFKFKYSGCGGNLNNFVKKGDCKRKCKK